MTSGHPIFAAVADDDTGATDLAGMLADQGLRTVLLIDIPGPEDYARWTAGQDAVIAGIGTRAMRPQEAYERTRAAVRLLKTAGPAAIAIKYCSTFDSTPDGNIGPSIDAAMDELDESFTIALPALPVNGRTTYMGYHFVHGQLLSESPMRNHPLNPMSEPNLVRLLQCQTRRNVGSAVHPAVAAGVSALCQEFGRLRSEGVEIAVVDCLSEGDVETICEAAADMRLITGSSAPAMKLPAVWRRHGLLGKSAGETAWLRPAPGGSGFLVVAGSCSEATRGQNDCAAASGARAHRIDAEALLGDYDHTALVRQVADDLSAGHTCLIATSEDPGGVRRVQDAARAAGMSISGASLKIARTLAEVVCRVVEARPPAGLLVAGGETSSAICRRLELGALQVGPNIEAGVPLCHSVGRFPMLVILKSGNFGGPDFYASARRRALGS